MRGAIPESQSERRGQIAAALALLLGLALLRVAEPLPQIAGGLLALAGGLPLLTLAFRTLRRWQEERAADLAAARRRERKAQRREREALRRDAQKKESGIATGAEQKRRIAEAARQGAARAEAETEARQREEREQQIETEARRWTMQTEAERRAALTALLRQRGLEALPGAADDGELRFAGANRVALYLPAERRAEPADLERLQSLRVTRKAAKGYLISIGGFAPDTVRALRDAPSLTLADSYFLADWTLRETSATSTPSST